MSQSLAKIYLHIIFGTKNREPILNALVLPELYSYIGGILGNLDCTPIQIGGEVDHTHILCLLSRNLTVSKLVEEIKTSSSKWLKTRDRSLRDFHWQRGYGVFSVSESRVNAVRDYIQEQARHHRKMTYQEELLTILQKYKVTYDERYLWD